MLLTSLRGDLRICSRTAATVCGIMNGLAWFKSTNSGSLTESLSHLVSPCVRYSLLSLSFYLFSPEIVLSSFLSLSLYLLSGRFISPKHISSRYALFLVISRSGFWYHGQINLIYIWTGPKVVSFNHSPSALSLPTCWSASEPKCILYSSSDYSALLNTHESGLPVTILRAF